MPQGRTGSMVLATSNVGKRRELMKLLPDWVRVLGLEESGVSLPPETADTFAANACIKAAAAADQTGLLAIADDSGLEVDALGGRPGVNSARFAGEAASDDANRRKLLAALRGTEPAKRSARFVCAVAFARPGRVLALAEGTCRGTILDEPRGSSGFGYDALFELADGRSLAELSADEKNAIGHRGTAYRRMLPILRREVSRAFGDAAEPGRW